MLKVCGTDHFAVAIEYSDYQYDEIGCCDACLRLEFHDGTILDIYESAPEKWKYDVVQEGGAHYFIDENNAFYIESEIKSHSLGDMIFID